MQHTIEVIISATNRKMKKTVVVVSPKIENQYLFFISAVVGTCLRSILKSSHFQSNWEMKEKYNKCSVYTNETVLSEKENVRIKHRAMLGSKYTNIVIIYNENLRSEIR